MKKKMDKSEKILLAVVISFAVFVVVLIAIVITIVLLRSSRSQCISVNGSISPISMDHRELAKLTKPLPSHLTEPTIFVAISSYRDPELCFTIRDLFDKARNPSRVFVGVVEQNDSSDALTCHIKNASDPNSDDPRKNFQDRIRSITLHYKEAKGPTYARHLCEGLWKNEEWYMMTDSHMRFEPAWDSDLLEMVHKTKRPKRSVITIYPEGFERIQEKKTVRYKILMRRGWRFEQIKMFNDQGIPEFESITTTEPIPKTPKHVPMYAACFVFGHSDILRLVPFHPDTPYLFFGEEFFLAARLLSYGFDLLGPTHSVSYHLWKRDYRKTYWEHDIIAQRDASIEKIKGIMTGKIVDEKYGMGNVRSWKEIQDYFGIDFEKRTFTRPNKPWKLPDDYRELE
jgi:[Skp1-protein]-hydroxyproline N-acetylglucosaminyltransferase